MPQFLRGSHRYCRGRRTARWPRCRARLGTIRHYRWRLRISAIIQRRGPRRRLLCRHLLRELTPVLFNKYWVAHPTRVGSTDLSDTIALCRAAQASLKSSIRSSNQNTVLAWFVSNARSLLTVSTVIPGSQSNRELSQGYFQPFEYFLLCGMQLASLLPLSLHVLRTRMD
jgi:hypothetical protein